MESNDKIFDQRTFSDQQVTCPRCGWKGAGSEAHVAEFYGIGKFKEVLCPNCDSHLGNLSRDRFFEEGPGKDPRREGEGID